MSAITQTRFADRRFAWLGEPLPDVGISFEFFPAKTPVAEARLWQTVEKLKALAPSYVSVTCGAGGNPAEGTQALVTALREAGLAAVPHLTCASASRRAIEQIAASYRAAGFRQIVALRGDRPKDGSHDDPDRYRFAAELVAALRRIGSFEISVAAYPEPHPEAQSAAADLDNLKRKIDAGASRAITQYCFDT
jgi:methylenetetrahydrofolate reductase (NADPH)